MHPDAYNEQTPQPPEQPRRAALRLIERAEKAVDDLCAGRLHWEMRVPAEPDHDPDLIISTALRAARSAIGAEAAAPDTELFEAAPDVPVTYLGSDSEWPAAVSDGLSLACSDCGEVPRFDYNVTEQFWRQWVSDKPARLSVVCLPCLDRRCGGVGLAEALVRVQWTGTGHTIILAPERRYDYADTIGIDLASGQDESVVMPRRKP